MTQLLVYIVVILCVAAPWIAWISIQSLFQASLLREAAKGLITNRSGKTVAVHGKVVIRSPLRHRDMGEVLWYKWTTKERYDDGESRGWRTAGSETAMAEFSLQSSAGEILIEDFPTELHGSKSRTTHDSTVEKTTIKWLPLREEMTVVGMLVRRLRGFSIIKSKKVGMLFSHRKPEDAAIQETIKGIGGLILVIGSLGTGLALWLSA